MLALRGGMRGSGWFMVGASEVGVKSNRPGPSRKSDPIRSKARRDGGAMIEIASLLQDPGANSEHEILNPRSITRMPYREDGRGLGATVYAIIDGRRRSAFAVDRPRACRHSSMSWK